MINPLTAPVSRRRVLHGMGVGGAVAMIEPPLSNTPSPVVPGLARRASVGTGGVPPLVGMQLGHGIQLSAGRVVGKGFNGGISTRSLPKNSDCYVIRIKNSAELAQLIGTHPEITGGVASFSTARSSRDGFASTVHVHDEELFFAVVVSRPQRIVEMVRPGLDQESARLVGDPREFYRHFGDYVAHTCVLGGLFVGIVTLNTHSPEQRARIEAAVTGKYQLHEPDLANALAALDSNLGVTLHCRVHCEGGAPPSQTAMTTCAELLTQARTWETSLSRVNADLSPLQWGVLPNYVCGGPDTPHARALDDAQQAQKWLAMEYLQGSTLVNKLRYQISHPNDYRWTDRTWRGTELSDVVSALHTVESYLTRVHQSGFRLVSACQGDDPTEALAAARALEGLPASPQVPQPVVHRTFVPGWADVSAIKWGDGRGDGAAPSAKQLGLEVKFHPVSDQSGVSKGTVLVLDPPAGSFIPQGSIVEVTYVE